MTLDHGAAALPPAEEAGLLFGFRKAGPPIGSEFAKAWKYQAPYSPVELAHEKTLERNRRTQQHWPPTWSDGSTWDMDHDVQREPIQPEARLDEFLYVSEQLMEGQDTKVEELLDRLHDGEALTESWWESIVKLLETTVQESGSDDLISVIQALKSDPVPVDCWKALASILEQKALLETASDAEVVRIFEVILERPDDWEDVSLVFAAKIGRTGSADTLLDLLEYIINSPEHATKTKPWLALLKCHHPATLSISIDTKSWKRFYGLLAQHFRPSDSSVVEHFGGLSRTNFALILLEFYLPAWIDVAAKRVQIRDANIDMGQLHGLKMTTERDILGNLSSTQEGMSGLGDFNLMDYGNFRSVEIRLRDVSTSMESATNNVLSQQLGQVQVRLKRLFRSGRLLSPHDRIDMRPYAIVDLVRLLQRCRLPYARLLEEAFEVYMQTQSTNTTKNLFLKLRTEEACAIPTTLAGKLVQHFIAAGNIDYAFYVFRDVPTLPLLPYSELLLKLIEDGKTHGGKIFEMFNRYHPEERLPLEQRQHPRLQITLKHVDLVHEAAYAFASSEHLSPRTAFRRVWECFRYLRDRRAPLQPLMSRAFVKAGITRPLKQRQRLSQEQVKYIVSIVDQIEGPQMAKEVDRIVWDSWNWTLERQWSLSQPRPHKGPAGQGRFYDKPRRLWIKGDGRVYMPFPEAVNAVEKEAGRIDNDSDQQCNSPDGSENIPAGVRPLNEQADICQPSGTSASLTDMDTFFDQSHNSTAPLREYTTDESRVIDSEDSELSLAEMNEVLKAHSDGSSYVEHSSLGQTAPVDALTERKADTANTSFSKDSADSGESDTSLDIIPDSLREQLDSMSKRMSGSGLLQKRLSLEGPVSFRHFQLWQEKPVEFRKGPSTVATVNIPGSAVPETPPDAKDIVEPTNFTLTYKRNEPKRVHLRYQ